MDIIQGNKVVAEYMGYKFNAYPELKHNNITKPGESSWYFATWIMSDYEEHITTELKYRSSWDEFMPAYNKFRSEVISPVLYEDLPKEVIEKWEKLEMSILTCDIRYAFELLVELINWKNNKS